VRVLSGNKLQLIDHIAGHEAPLITGFLLGYVITFISSCGSSLHVQSVLDPRGMWASYHEKHLDFLLGFVNRSSVKWPYDSRVHASWRDTR
jgi:hypothetical protein